MFNFKVLTSAIAVSFAVSAIAGPVARKSFTTHPITKKIGKSIPATVAKDQARISKFNGAANGSSATVTNDVDSYIASVTVGSQTFNLIVDTGSSNTWVGANTNYTGSGTNTGNAVSVSYGSGSFNGTEYIDSVTIGTATVANQSIGVAASSTGFTGVDGIVGFGPVDLTASTVDNETTVPTFMDNLSSAEILGVSFAPETGSSNNSANGELTFGGTDSSKYNGSIAYTPKSNSTDFGPYWGVTVSSIDLGSTSLASSGDAIVDTGTTLIYIPTAAYTKFLSAANGTTDSTTGLAQFTTEPTDTFSFTIGGTKLSLTPAQYLVPSAQYTNFGITGSAYYSWIGDGGASAVDFIIGQKFLENYYSVFDTVNQQVGFATAA